MTQREIRLNKLSIAADARANGALVIAKRYGFNTAQDAYNEMGKAFTNLVKQQAPSINEAMAS